MIYISLSVGLPRKKSWSY